ncbi:FAD-dependent oxidoreductase [Pseudidiomarina sp.]|uniref:FAD-dependent oxidoreductase n=1 Tax=Pseudidiomarina sp. TaxID=2081707 RepID=UPI003A96B78E
MIESLNEDTVDAVVVGGGFYGSSIAAYLVEVVGLHKVVLIEKENDLLQRASFCNQARVHNGYHYPRSFTTAYRSRVNLPKFVQKWGFAVKSDFKKLYAIAKRNSKVTSKQFERFCNEIGAPISPAQNAERKLFNPQLIDDIFEVEELAFDARKLRDFAVKELKRLGVDVLLNTQLTSITRDTNQSYICATRSKNSSSKQIRTKRIFNCTYSGVQQIKGDFNGIKSSIKHELTEMALIRPPASFENLGITVMDGPFFSAMPFPSKDLHSMSHVRYTPHLSWLEDRLIDPYEKLENYNFSSRFDRMKRDISRYIPDFENCEYVESLLEIKTILLKNETDDGRPILFEKDKDLPGVYTILGGKIDNIFDIFEKLDHEVRT